MQKLTLDLPTMYGDHHVTEVRRILLEMPGVENVNASSCFQFAEVTYDPDRLDAVTITAMLEKAGYIGDLDVPFETGVVADSQVGGPAFLRHTVAYQQTGPVIGFAQNVAYTGRALWPCPGTGTMKSKEMSDGEEKP